MDGQLRHALKFHGIWLKYLFIRSTFMGFGNIFRSFFQIKPKRNIAKQEAMENFVFPNEI